MMSDVFDGGQVSLSNHDQVIADHHKQQQQQQQQSPQQMNKRSRARLDEDGCINLLSILQVVNQIDQEQAWAICYEVCILMKRLSSQEQAVTDDDRDRDHDHDHDQSSSKVSCAPIKSLAQIHLHEDGYVHEKSCLFNQNNSWLQQQHQLKQQLNSSSENASPISRTPTPPNSDQETEERDDMNDNDDERCLSPNELDEILKRRPALNENELVASLGIALFWALDYGIPDDEERKLSLAMEYLIIQSQSKLSLDEISTICINRLPLATKSHADSHYAEVCKSLVNDTIQLSIFLEKIYTASMVLSDISEQDLDELGEPLASLRALRIDDWARLWMHVIKELKQALSIT